MPKLSKPVGMVNRQAVGTYQGKLHQRSSGAYGAGTTTVKGRRPGKVSGGDGEKDTRAVSGKLNDIRCDGHVVAISSLIPDPNNARLHPERNLDAIKQSLATYGQRAPLVVREQNRMVAAGNGRLAAAKELGWTKMAVSIRPMTDAEFIGYALADNRTAELAKWDFEVVARLEALQREAGGGMIGWSAEEIAILRSQYEMGSTNLPPLKASLSERFGVPPFSVLDARQGYWQARKRAWLALGIQSELGRGSTPTTYHEHLGKGLADGHEAIREQQKGVRRANATPGGSLLEAATLSSDGRTVRGDGRGRKIDNGLLGFSEQARSHYARTKGSGGPGDLAAELKARGAHPLPGGGMGKNSAWMFKTPEGYKSLKGIQSAQDSGLAVGITCDAYRAPGEPTTSAQSGTSIFDPVLCELAYRWFCRPKGKILDPFAGGSVRGIVASKLERRYWGIDLSAAQVAANRDQGKIITPDNQPTWHVADALSLPVLAKKEKIPNKVDFIFSCPPYFDLERYSDDGRDLSTMSWDKFVNAYGRIISAACDLLANNRFACFCVGDVRCRKTGFYRGLVGTTIGAFSKAGLSLYNEAILVTAVGSLSIRTGKQFSNYRKLGKTHQNVLVFVKGDWRKATEWVGPVEMGEVDGLEVGDVDIRDE